MLAICGRLNGRVFVNNGDARAEIMRSIRSHLAVSSPHNGRGTRINTEPCTSVFPSAVGSVVEEFKRNLEAVDGHCFIASDDADVAAVLARLTDRKRTRLNS